MTPQPDGISFYFFDFDDNIMYLSTPIFILDTVTREKRALSTGEFADVYPLLGAPGKWANYSMFDGSYRNFRDIPAGQLEPGQMQYFASDVAAAADSTERSWRGPSWDLFVYACQKQRPVSIITARGHSPETIRAGICVLVRKGLIPREPNYHTIFPVGNDAVRRELGDAHLDLTTPVLKKAAILKSVEKAVEQYGCEPEHCFGMSDDDPQNVRLIIAAMRDCKIKHPRQRFFVIDTHLDESVKLEVFPVDYPVTGRSAAEPGEIVR